MPASKLIQLSKWREEIGVSKTTIRNWQSRWPWFRTVSILGKHYISREVIETFEQKAATGELSEAAK